MVPGGNTEMSNHRDATSHDARTMSDWGDTEMSNHRDIMSHDARTVSDWGNTFSVRIAHKTDPKGHNEGTLNSEAHTDQSGGNEERADTMVERADTMVERADTIVERADTIVERADTIVERAGLTGIKAESKAGGLKKERRKRAKYLPETVPLQLPPCRICGKPASGIHYGVNSCEACKGFFRRSMKRGEAYKCRKGGNCAVGQALGLSCSGCRLLKCVRLGMSKEGIRQGRYTLKERTMTIMEVKKLKEDQTNDSTEPKSCRSATCETGLSPLTDRYHPSLCDQSRSGTGLSGSLRSLSSDHSGSESGFSRSHRSLSIDHSGSKSGLSGYHRLLSSDHSTSEPGFSKSHYPSHNNQSSQSKSDLGYSGPLHPSLSDNSGSESSLSGSYNLSTSKSHLIHPKCSSTESCSSEFPPVESQTGSTDPGDSSFGPCLETSQESSSGTQIHHSSSARASHNASDVRTFPVITDDLSEQSMVLFIESLMTGYNEMKPFTKDMSDEEIQVLLQDGFTKYNQKIQLFGNMDPLPANMYNEIFNMTNMDIDGRTKILELIRTELVTVIHEYVRFTHGIPAFKNLDPNDQASLLKAARLEFFLLLSYRTLDPDTGMMISYTGHVLPIRQFCAYAPGDMSTSWLEVSRDIRRLHLLPREHAAMLAICLTFTDRCSLQNPQAVEKVQSDLLLVLQYLLRERYQEGCGRQLAKIMDVFVKLRGLNEEFLMVYQKICQDRFLIEHLPELLQFLFDE